MLNKVVLLILAEAYSDWHNFYAETFTTGLDRRVKDRFPKAWTYVQECWANIGTHVVVGGILSLLQLV